MVRKKQNRELETIEIIDAGSEGKAVGKTGEKVIFVPFAMPGDVVDLVITKRRKSYLEGSIKQFRKKSPRRIEPFCEYFGTCGGCKWQHMTYEDQLFFKQKQVKDNLERIGGIDTSMMADIIASPSERYYRNKLEFSFSDRRWIFPNEPDGIKNEPGLGFHVPRIFDKVIDIRQCYLMAEPSNKIRNWIKDYAVQNALSFYNPRKWEGLLRTLVIRISSSGDVLINLVVNTFRENEKKQTFQLLADLQETFPEITALFYTVSDKKNDSLSGLEATHFSGEKHIMETMEDLKFRVAPMSFYQTNSHQAFELYRIAREFANLKGNEHVYDLYTGAGTIALFMARQAKHVTGIEYVPEAISDARENARFNGIENATFIHGDMAKVFNRELIATHGHPDIVIVDPPRAGMHPDVVKQLLDSSPERIVYVSCNPATQARDLKLMKETYRILKIQPVDMFPQTHHVENIVLLEKKSD